MRVGKLPRPRILYRGTEHGAVWFTARFIGSRRPAGEVAQTRAPSIRVAKVTAPLVAERNDNARDGGWPD